MSYFEAITSGIAATYVLVAALTSLYDAYAYVVLAFMYQPDLWYALGLSLGSLVAFFFFAWLGLVCLFRSAYPAWRRARGLD